MFRLTLRNLLHKKIRFAFTTGIVVIGVTFVVGVFALTDSIRSSFDDLAADIESGIDLTVRVPLEIGDELDRVHVSQGVADQVAAVPGVAQVNGRVVARNTSVIDNNGEPIAPRGPPTRGFSWFPTQFFVVDGRAPDGPDEFAINSKSAVAHDLVVGNTYDISGPNQQRSFQLVGIYYFGDPNKDKSLAATAVAFDNATAQEFLNGGEGFNEISVAIEPGADRATVQQSVADAVGSGYEVIDRSAKIEETQADFGQFISIFGNVLLAFALIGVFVSAFIINNVFQIVLGQRVRELGLLRAIGATGRQVSRSVVGEAALVGLFSTIIGLVAGLGLARVLRILLKSGGFALPDGPIGLRPRTVIFAVVVGMGVTLISSILPARRARSISPMAALSDTAKLAKGSLATRALIGGLMVSIGAVLLGLGLFGGFDTKPLLLAISVGAIMVFIGTTVLSPVFASQVARHIGWPIQKVFGVPGKLARENAARSPRRTSSTAGALMIGLALVSMAGVVGQSIKETFADTIDNSVQADYFIQSASGGFDPNVGFSSEVIDQLAALPELDLIVGYRFGLDSINVNGSTKNVFTTDFAAGVSHMDPGVLSGSIANADPLGSILLHKDPARDLQAAVGDTLVVGFPDGEFEALTVAAIYADSTIYDNYVIDNSLWDRHFNRSELMFATATISGYSDALPDDEKTALLASSASATEKVTESYPTVTVENRVQFRETQQARLDSFLVVISVFLGLALFIALIGISITLALSVFERTREIGLLRAVGLSRRQLRRAIRWEAAIVSVFGALLGIGLGLVFGVAAAVAIPDTAIKSVAIPWRNLVIYVIVAALAGLVAAILPARRAAKMNVLEAIATE